ncbi:polysaccharide deacetylase family protein [Flavisolibacter ginsenosidimutans]|uniref:Polysaccharide deacetylase family protein n=1 Tax=Flavisolibacter ginsenosidimutans TaxID=661481 RepID=A0A5B8UGE9_9BACT|nr:polysaccharide deacetylase family protein [Flavisolibacter ginsenosidimutans]QEC55209.1 polysaccharide deacetylase family protein [Flavisolibacter ginsenosidimutans]
MNLRQFVKRFLRSPKVVVLMYHRVANVEADPWQLAVSPENFEAQLKLLRKKYKVITPQQLLKQNPRWRLGKNRVCITFDDGYLDNFTTAKPLLEKYRCPATFFITTHSLQTAKPYWWDELQEIIFSAPKLPSPFLLEIAGTKIVCELENGGTLTSGQEAKQKEWIWSDEPPTQRCRLYFSLWEKMRSLPQSEIEASLVQLKEMIGGMKMTLHDSMPMTIINLKDMSRQTLFQIGLHTHTHPVLSDHSFAFQQKELEENKKILEQVCGYPITILSYPHGRFNDDTLALAKDLKLTAAFTTMPEPAMSYSPPHKLGRYQVLNWNEEAFDSFLKKTFAS